MRSAALQRQHFANSRLAAPPASPAPKPPEVCYFLAFSPFPPCLNKFENIASLSGAQPAGAAHQPPLLAAAPAGAARSRREGQSRCNPPGPTGTAGGDPGGGPRTGSGASPGGEGQPRTRGKPDPCSRAAESRLGSLGLQKKPGRAGAEPAAAPGCPPRALGAGEGVAAGINLFPLVL